jgi:tetratricopeptide (TPR) repeat protein
MLVQAVDKSKQSSVVHFLARRHRGHMLLEAGDYGGALTDLLTVNELGDHTAATMIGIARIWKQLGRSEDAEDAFHKALQETSKIKTCQAWTQLCIACRKMGVTSWIAEASKQALEAFDNEFEPTTADGRAHLEIKRAQILMDAGRYDEAFDACTEVIKTLTKVYADGGIKNCSCLEGAHHFRGWVLAHCRGDYEAARTEYEIARKGRPNDKYVLSNYGLVLSALGRYHDAATAYHEAISADPFYVLSYHYLSELLSTKLDDHEQALNTINSVLEIKSHDLQALLKCSRFLKILGRFDEAEEVLNQAVAVALSNADPHRDGALVRRNCAYYLWCQQRFEEAFGVIERALNFEPEDPNSLAVRALVYASLGQSEEAQEDIAKIRQSERLTEWTLFNCREVLTWYLRDYGQAMEFAEEDFKAIVAPSFEDEIALGYYKVYCLRGLGREEEAREEAKRLVLEARLNTNIEPGVYIAYLFAFAGDRQQAEAILESLEEPTDGMGFGNHARVFATAGNDERALELLDRAAEAGLRWYPQPVDLGPDFEHLKDDPRYQAILAKIHGE